MEQLTPKVESNTSSQWSGIWLEWMGPEPIGTCLNLIHDAWMYVDNMTSIFYVECTKVWTIFLFFFHDHIKHVQSLVNNMVPNNTVLDNILVVIAWPIHEGSTLDMWFNKALLLGTVFPTRKPIQESLFPIHTPIFPQLHVRCLSFILSYAKVFLALLEEENVKSAKCEAHIWRVWEFTSWNFKTKFLYWKGYHHQHLALDATIATYW